MSTAYLRVIEHLLTRLSIAQPDTIDSVTSLQLDEFTCHLTEHPTDHLLMFTSITPALEAPIDEQNLFCQDLCKPLLGRDPLSQEQILWSRQPLFQMEHHMAVHQLEQLIHAAEQLSQQR